MYVVVSVETQTLEAARKVVTGLRTSTVPHVTLINVCVTRTILADRIFFG